MAAKQTTNFKDHTKNSRKPKSTSGENKEFQEAKKRHDGLFDKKKKKFAPLFASSPLPPLVSDRLTNEFYFGQGVNSTLKGLRKIGLNVPKNARALYELTDPDSQCKKSVGGPTSETPCYICKLQMENLVNSGFYYDKNQQKTSFLWTGRQCEHIIPVLMMAIICGLCDYKGGVRAASPEKSITRYFKKLANAYPSEKENIENLMREYETWQRGCWLLSYAWSHTECNMVKNEFPFLAFLIQWTNINKPSIEVKDDIQKNLGNLLRNLLSKPNNVWCDMFRAVYKGDIFEILKTQYTGMSEHEQVESWIQDTIERVKEENLLPLITHLKKNDAYFNVSLSILKDTICESVEDDPEAIERILGEDTVIAKLIHFSAKRLEANITHRGGAEPGSEMEPGPEMVSGAEMEPESARGGNNEIIDLANILVNLSSLDERPKLRRTATIEAAEALLHLQNGTPENAELMTKENITRLIIDIFEDNDTSEIIAGAIYLMYLHNYNSGHNPYANAIQIVNEWMLGKGGDYEKEFNSLIKRIKSVYGEIIIKDDLIAHAATPTRILAPHTKSVIDVIKDIEHSVGQGKKEATTIICGIAEGQFSDEAEDDSSYTLTEIFDVFTNLCTVGMASKKKKHTKRKKKRKNKQRVKRSRKKSKMR